MCLEDFLLPSALLTALDLRLAVAASVSFVRRPGPVTAKAVTAVVLFGVQTGFAS